MKLKLENTECQTVGYTQSRNLSKMIITNKREITEGPDTISRTDGQTDGRTAGRMCIWTEILKLGNTHIHNSVYWVEINQLSNLIHDLHILIELNYDSHQQYIGWFYATVNAKETFTMVPIGPLL